MYKLDNFKTCCDYLGIDNTLPVCQIDERRIQAAYKLRVCMKAWNKQDGFEPDEKANSNDDNVGFVPWYSLDNESLLTNVCGLMGSTSGLFPVYKGFQTVNYGLRISLSTEDRAFEFGEVFIDIFNELI